MFHPWEEGFYLSVVGVVSSDGDRTVFWFVHNQRMPTVHGSPRLQELIDSADLVVAHNFKFDMNVLRYSGINFDDTDIWCTQVAEYLLNGQDKDVSYSLDETSKRYGFEGKLDCVKEQWLLGVETKDIDPDMLFEYVLSDAELCLGVYQKQIEKAQELNLVRLIELQSEYIKCLSDIEINGFKCDVNRAKQIIEETESKIESLETEFKELCGEPHLNMGSPQQRSACLFGGPIKVSVPKWVTIPLKTKPETIYKEVLEVHEYEHPGLGFEPPKRARKTASGHWPADKLTLDQLSCGKNKLLKRVKELLFEHSHLNKIKNTIEGKGGKGLVNRIAPDGLIHPKINNTVTTTGRLSSDSQQFPRGNTSPIKECIVPRYDGIYQIDLSQIEWRAAAQLSQDTVMIKEINDKVDQHIQAVKDLMELKFTSKSDPESKANRDHAKVFNFRMIYGGDSYGFFMDPKMPRFSKAKWKKICEGFQSKYAGLSEYNTRNIGHVLSNATLAIPTGRYFRFKKEVYKDGVKTYNERQIKNYPVQGLAGGDVLPLLATVIRRGLCSGGFKTKLILTVHDSLVFDYVESELGRLNKLCLTVASLLPQYYEAYFGHRWHTRIDAEAEVGPNYGALKFYGETK